MNRVLFAITGLLIMHLSFADAICNDGWVSLSEGRGTCSWHKGVRTWYPDRTFSSSGYPNKYTSNYYGGGGISKEDSETILKVGAVILGIIVVDELHKQGVITTPNKSLIKEAKEFNGENYNWNKKESFLPLNNKTPSPLNNKLHYANDKPPPNSLRPYKGLNCIKSSPWGSHYQCNDSVGKFIGRGEVISGIFYPNGMQPSYDNGISNKSEGNSFWGEKFFKKGEEYFAKRDYESAVRWYKKSLDKGFNKAKPSLSMAKKALQKERDRW
jgi:hypothetical protein